MRQLNFQKFSRANSYTFRTDRHISYDYYRNSFHILKMCMNEICTYICIQSEIMRKRYMFYTQNEQVLFKYMCRFEIKAEREKEIIIAVTSTYFIVSLLHSRLRFMTSNFLLHRIMAVNLCIYLPTSLLTIKKDFCRTFFIRLSLFLFNFQ